MMLSKFVCLKVMTSVSRMVYMKKLDRTETLIIVLVCVLCFQTLYEELSETESPIFPLLHVLCFQRQPIFITKTSLFKYTENFTTKK